MFTLVQGTNIPNTLKDGSQVWIMTTNHPESVLLSKYSASKGVFINKEGSFSRNHNIHQYFQDNADEEKIVTLDSGMMWLLDPYMVHRRPKIRAGVKRKMFRISFVPIEIKDDTYTQNPLLPSGPYNRKDIRDSLIRYGEI